MRNLQPVHERECRDIFTAIGDLGELILKVANVRLEAVTLPHFDSEEVVAILLSLSAGSVLGEKRLSYLLIIMEEMRRQ